MIFFPWCDEENEHKDGYIDSICVCVYGITSRSFIYTKKILIMCDSYSEMNVGWKIQTRHGIDELKGRVRASIYEAVWADNSKKRKDFVVFSILQMKLISLVTTTFAIWSVYLWCRLCISARKLISCYCWTCFDFEWKKINYKWFSHFSIKCIKIYR